MEDLSKDYNEFKYHIEITGPFHLEKETILITLYNNNKRYGSVIPIDGDIKKLKNFIDMAKIQLDEILTGDSFDTERNS